MSVQHNNITKEFFTTLIKRAFQPLKSSKKIKAVKKSSSYTEKQTRSRKSEDILKKPGSTKLKKGGRYEAR